jgi:hypothetical protein
MAIWTAYKNLGIISSALRFNGCSLFIWVQFSRCRLLNWLLTGMRKIPCSVLYLIEYFMSVVLTIPYLIRNNYSIIYSNNRNNFSIFELRNKLFWAEIRIIPYLDLCIRRACLHEVLSVSEPKKDTRVSYGALLSACHSDVAHRFLMENGAKQYGLRSWFPWIKQGKIGII